MSPDLFPARALLLIGPTGAGKTPLGEHIEREGIAGKRYFHCDFGHELRGIAAADSAPAGFSRDDISFIREVLSQGALLENEHFHIAEKIVCHFLERNEFCENDAVILNGLPRHVDQAQDMNRLITVEGLIVLACGADDVRTRIRHNTGADRTGRIDDDIAMIRRKLLIFSERTAPLIDYYKEAGARVFTVKVGPSSTAGDVYAEISRSFR